MTRQEDVKQRRQVTRKPVRKPTKSKWAKRWAVAKMRAAQIFVTLICGAGILMMVGTAAKAWELDQWIEARYQAIRARVEAR